MSNVKNCYRVSDNKTIVRYFGTILEASAFVFINRAKMPGLKTTVVDVVTTTAKNRRD